MLTVMAYHDVKDKDHWLASPRRDQFFGPSRCYQHSDVRRSGEPDGAGQVMDVPDMEAVITAIETEEADDAMAYDGVLPETLVILVEA